MRDELARARQDSLDREQAARDAAERLAMRRRSDSLAREGAEARTILEARIHFDFDRSEIRPADRELLERKVPILLANPSVRIRVAGNCDERGSEEYNLALGQRRAIAVREFLAGRGVDPARLEVASNGEEQPVDPGHTEAAWAMNRNDQFSVLNSSVALTLPGDYR